MPLYMSIILTCSEACTPSFMCIIMMLAIFECLGGGHTDSLVSLARPMTLLLGTQRVSGSEVQTKKAYG